MMKRIIEIALGIWLAALLPFVVLITLVALGMMVESVVADPKAALTTLAFLGFFVAIALVARVATNRYRR